MLLVDSTFVNKGHGGIAHDNRFVSLKLQSELEAKLLFDRNSYIENCSGLHLRSSLKSINVRALLMRKTVSGISWNGDFYQTHLTGLRSPARFGVTYLRIHDIFPISNPEWFTYFGQKLFDIAAENIQPGTVLICNSKSTQKRISKNKQFGKFESLVVPCPISSIIEYDNPCGNCAVCSQQFNFSEFLLAVGTLEPRKNYGRLLEAWKKVHSKSDFKSLLIVGKFGWKSESLRKSLEVEESIAWITPCGYGLTRLYESASGFISASLAEGFDIPSAQAELYNLGIALSDIDVHRELVPNAEVFFDPLSVSSIESAIRVLEPRIPRKLVSFKDSNFEIGIQNFINKLHSET
jgi:glycosyltransferase involved in cell wall biosynthesis